MLCVYSGVVGHKCCRGEEGGKNLQFSNRLLQISDGGDYMYMVFKMSILLQNCLKIVDF